MTINTDNENDSNQLVAVIKAFVLALFAVVISVVSVSFAVHHMRIGFESEYAEIYENKIMNLATTSALIINGDDIVLDPTAAGQKYSAVINLLLPKNTDDSYSTINFGLYQYQDGILYVIHESSTENVFSASQVDPSNWFKANLKPYIIESGKSISILVPITDSQKNVVGLFEMDGQYSGLSSFGDVLEGKILLAVIVSVSIGLLLFSIQYALPKILSVRKKSWEDRE
jgi:hypothetical protein